MLLKHDLGIEKVETIYFDIMGGYYKISKGDNKLKYYLQCHCICTD